jgi:hypothetical protein
MPRHAAKCANLARYFCGERPVDRYRMSGASAIGRAGRRGRSPDAKWSARSSTQQSWSAEQARRVVDEWKQSGVTVAEFARKRGLVPERLYLWRKRLPALMPRRRQSST